MLAQDGGSNSAIVSLSDEVIVYEDTIRKCAKEYDIEDYVSLLQAIMMQEHLFLLVMKQRYLYLELNIKQVIELFLRMILLR